MSDLLVKIGPGAGYEDGDVLFAANRRRVRHIHAEHLCFARDPETRRYARLNGAGLLPADDAARDFCEATRELRLERLSRTEGRLVRIADGAEIRFESNKPFAQFDGRMVHMDLEAFCRRMLRTLDEQNARGLPVFGTDRQRPVWYGGRIDVSTPALDQVWAAITAKLGRRDDEPAFSGWPFGTQEIRSHLPMRLAGDMDDEEENALVSPEMDDADPDNPLMLRKRRHSVAWREGRSAADQARIADPREAVDERASRQWPRQIVVAKPPLPPAEIARRREEAIRQP